MRYLSSLIHVILFVVCNLHPVIAQSSVKIGSQVWMASNLRVTHFRNGDPIPEIKSAKEWTETYKKGLPARCSYENDNENGITGGSLYNWYAVIDPRGLAPEGWIIPEVSDWQILIKTLGPSYSIAEKLKDSVGWANFNGTNVSSFKAVPAGYRQGDGSFVNKGYFTSFWSKTTMLKGSEIVKRIFTLGDYGNLLESSAKDASGYSVRCVQNR